MSTFYRTVKSKDNPFVMVDKRPVENRSLSWAAKGMLSYLLSRPDGWEVVFEDLVNRSTDGKDANRTIVNELYAAGHIVKGVLRDERGKIVKHTYDVYENPDEATTGLSTSGLASSGKSAPINTELSTNTESTPTESETPNWSYEWQIAMGVEKIKPFNQNVAIFKDRAMLVGMYTDNHKLAEELAMAYMLTRNMEIPESGIKGARKCIKEMMEMHVKPEHVAQATQELMGAKTKDGKSLTIKNIFSVQGTAIAKANPGLEQTEHGFIEGV